MKGIVFTEFLEMVEARFGLPIVDQIITQSALPSEGVYTAVGTYDHNEIVRLVDSLARITELPQGALYKAYGEHLFSRFAALYPGLFHGPSNAFEFLLVVEDYIHVEVRKIYPDAELPRFTCNTPTPNYMEMEYRSRRGLGDFAEGLIRGCAANFGESLTIEREDLPIIDGEFGILFKLTRNPLLPKRDA